MAVSRRRFVTSVLAGSALAAVSTTELAAVLASPASAASPPGRRGRQDHRRLPGLVRLPRRRRTDQRLVALEPRPVPAAVAGATPTIVSWPDMREYTRSYPTAYANLGNGQPATLFSSYDQQTVDTHFRWMQQYGCDTAALQRFNPIGGEGPTRDAMAEKVRAAAEALRPQVLHHVRRHRAGRTCSRRSRPTGRRRCRRTPRPPRTPGRTASRSSASGASASTTPGRPFAPAACLDVVNWFKAQGCYVIGGVPTYWRQGINDSRPGFLDVYHAFNMISPWMVGRTGDLAGLDSFYNNVNVADQADCNANGIDYQPCVMPGDLSSRPPPARRLLLAALLQHDPGRRAGPLRLDVRRVQRGQPDRQDRRDAGHARPAGVEHPRARRGRHGLLVGLLPADHRRRRPDAQGPARADRRSAPPSRWSAAPPTRPTGTWPPASRPRPAARTAASPPATRSTATSAATGRAPTARSRSGCRSTSAPRPGQPGRAEAAAGWGAVPRRIPVQGSANGSQLRHARRRAPACTFDPATGNTVDPSRCRHAGPLRPADASPATPAGRPPRSPSSRCTAGIAAHRQPADRAGQPDRHRQDDHQRVAVLDGVDRRRRRDRLPGAPGRHRRRHRRRGTSLHGERAEPVHRYTFSVIARDAAGNTVQPRPTRSPSTTDARRPTPTWPGASRPPRAATSRATARATWSTATPTATGRAPTTRSRSGCRSTSAPRPRSAGSC